jgi:hypothetical protein
MGAFAETANRLLFADQWKQISVFHIYIFKRKHKYRYRYICRHIYINKCICIYMYINIQQIYASVSNRKQKPVIFLNPFTICLHANRSLSFVHLLMKSICKQIKWINRTKWTKRTCLSMVPSKLAPIRMLGWGHVWLLKLTTETTQNDLK